MVEGEKDRTQDGRRLIIGAGLELRMHIDDKSGADGTEQTCKYQGSIEVLIVFFDIGHVIFGRLPLVHCVEIEPRIVVLDRLEEYPQSIFEALRIYL